MRQVTLTFEPQLKSLDNFAGKQLDRIETGCAKIRDSPRAVYQGSRSVVDSIICWQITAEIQARLEVTIERLKNSETYINFLMDRMRNATSQVQKDVNFRIETWSEAVHAQKVGAEMQAQHLRGRIKREIVQILKNVVDLINDNGYLLPAPGQQLLKKFVMSLPSRLLSEANSPISSSSRLVLMANEAVVLIKSLSNVLVQYLLWARPLQTDEEGQTKSQVQVEAQVQLQVQERDSFKDLAL